jgi:hypothetical protein
MRQRHAGGRRFGEIIYDAIRVDASDWDLSDGWTASFAKLPRETLHIARTSTQRGHHRIFSCMISPQPFRLRCCELNRCLRSMLILTKGGSDINDGAWDVPAFFAMLTAP